MDMAELKDRLTSALYPILADAERDGMLVGGTLNLCERDTSGRGWQRVARVTIMRKGTECVVTEFVERERKVVRDPAPMPKMNVEQAKAIVSLANAAIDVDFPVATIEHNPPGEQYTGEVCPRPECGSSRVVRRGGCSICLACGESVGGCG